MGLYSINVEVYWGQQNTTQNQVKKCSFSSRYQRLLLRKQVTQLLVFS